MLAQTFFATFCGQKYKNNPCQFWAWRESNLGFEIHMDDRNNQLIILGGPVNLNLPLSVKICIGLAPGRRQEVGEQQSQGKFFPGWRAEDGGQRVEADEKGSFYFPLVTPLYTHHSSKLISSLIQNTTRVCNIFCLILITLLSLHWLEYQQSDLVQRILPSGPLEQN